MKRYYFKTRDVDYYYGRADCSADTVEEAESRIRRTWPAGSKPLLRLVLAHVCEHNRSHETPEQCARSER